MFPEVISNGLASLQEGKLRYVKTVRMEFTPSLQKGHVEFFNGAIRVTASGSPTSEVQGIFDDDGGARGVSPLLERRREPESTGVADAPRSPDRRPTSSPCSAGCATSRCLLRKKRLQRGALELAMPEAVLEYDAHGRVSRGALRREQPQPPGHRGVHARGQRGRGRALHRATRCRSSAASTRPRTRRSSKRSPSSPTCSATRSSGRRTGSSCSGCCDETADKPERAAVHFALLRSLKQATYSPIQDEHYALASQHYCHFTSPDPPLPGPAGPPPARPVDQDRQGVRRRERAGGPRRPLLEDGAAGRDGRAGAGEAEDPART